MKHKLCSLILNNYMGSSHLLEEMTWSPWKYNTVNKPAIDSHNNLSQEDELSDQTMNNNLSATAWTCWPITAQSRTSLILCRHALSHWNERVLKEPWVKYSKVIYFWMYKPTHKYKPDCNQNRHIVVVWITLARLTGICLPLPVLSRRSLPSGLGVKCQHLLHVYRPFSIHQPQVLYGALYRLDWFIKIIWGSW